MEAIETIKSYLNSKHEDMINLLERIVNIESGPEQFEGVNEIRAIFQQEFDQLGLKTRWIDFEKTGGIIVADYVPEDVKILHQLY
ncbi:hypothetical protein ACF3NG_02625 [Aerococcaceae bacterium WGS1372]